MDGAAGKGDSGASDELFRAAYAELRLLARRQMAGTFSTLQPTALVHEAWLRIGGDKQTRWRSRAHFFGTAAEAMRCILIDRARRRQAVRHGGGQVRVAFDDIDLPMSYENDERLLAINESLGRLAAFDAPKAELVKLRYFAGLEITEAAEVLGISESTAKRWWNYARAWLHRELRAS